MKKYGEKPILEILVQTDPEGTVELESGEVLRLSEMPFFCEHAVNRW